MFIRMFGGVIEPEYETKGSSGMDIRFFDPSSLEERFYTDTMKVFRTGLKVDLDPGTELQVRPRSGLAFKYGITVLNTPGTIDSDYEGEICICLINRGQQALTIKRGDRIAQLVYAKVDQAPFANVKCTDRGEGGFGSTGRS